MPHMVSLVAVKRLPMEHLQASPVLFRTVDGQPSLDLAWLLRTWRKEVARLDAATVAERLEAGARPGRSYSAEAIWSWERGERLPNDMRAVVVALDRLYGARGALACLAAAAGTPLGLPARRTWWHNFPTTGGPVWAWTRPGPGQSSVELTITWGALQVKLKRACGPEGFFVTSPVSTHNPPPRVEMRQPGWVDFGTGYLPVEQLGLVAVPALLRARPVRVRENLASALHRRSSTLLVYLEHNTVLRRPLDILEQTVADNDPGDPAFRAGFSDLSSAAPAQMTAAAAFDGKQYATLRRARGLSQAEAAKEATLLLPDVPVRKSHVDSLERRGKANVTALKSRLDTVYGADGTTFSELVEVTPLDAAQLTSPSSSLPRGCRAVRPEFPSYWVGPVWFRFRYISREEGQTATVVLHWGPWQRAVRARPGTAVACRRPCSVDPLVVLVPAGWGVTAGMGTEPGAVDLNWGWVAAGLDGAESIFRQMIPLYQRMLEQVAPRTMRLAHIQKRLLKRQAWLSGSNGPHAAQERGDGYAYGDLFRPL